VQRGVPERAVCVCVCVGGAQEVTSLSFASYGKETGEAKEMLVTGSHDGLTRLWTLDGCLVGTFGVDLWQCDNPTTFVDDEADYRLQPDEGVVDPPAAGSEGQVRPIPSEPYIPVLAIETSIESLFLNLNMGCHAAGGGGGGGGGGDGAAATHCSTRGAGGGHDPGAVPQPREQTSHCVKTRKSVKSRSLLLGWS
jgi:hypothetical protein